MKFSDFFYAVLALCMAPALVIAFSEPRPRRDVRHWSIGDANVGASGTYCADHLPIDAPSVIDKKELPQ